MNESFEKNADEKQEIINQFHRLYYNDSRQTWENTFWMGVPAQKCPLDLWIYQEIIYELKPDVIIETGTASGGSVLFLASICDMINNGKVITIDIEDKKGRPEHERIKYLLGSSTSEESIKQIKKIISSKDKVMVILDSDHSKDHILNELRIYSEFVNMGSYIIVEDTNVNGHPVFQNHGPGPMEAVEEFLNENNDFEIDKTKEKFYFTFNPYGYLKKIR